MAAIGAEQHEAGLAADAVRAALDPDALAAAQAAGRALATDDALREVIASAGAGGDHRQDGQDPMTPPRPPAGDGLAVGRQTPLEPDGLDGPSPFPPIAEYAFLSDCETNALVAPSGNVEWLCSPRPDGRSVFAAMLDRAAGGFRLGPTGVAVPAGRRYLPGTLVLETTWRARGGWIVVRDAMCVGPWYHQQRRSGTHRRPPTDFEAEHILLRTVKCIIGNVELSLDCEPVFNYGRTEARWEYSGQGYGEAIAHGGEGDVQLRLVTDLESASRAAAPTPGPPCTRATGPSPPCAGPARSGRPPRSTGPSGPRRPTPTRRSSGWSGRRSSGGAGSTRACSPSTAGRATSSAAP